MLLRSMESTMLFRLPILILFLFAIIANASVYVVGPDRQYERIIDCPTFDLQAGDTIKVYAKEEPYYEKFLLNGIGVEEAPIVLIGIPDEDGNKPIIDGIDAMSSLETAYWNEPRQLILVGQFDARFSDYIIVDGFELRNANMLHTYTDDHQEVVRYAENACGIRAEYCGHLIVRNCDIHDNANGFQNGETDREQYVTLESCHIYDNGAGPDPDRWLEHNIYAMGRDIHLTVQFCWFGELQNDGQQLKSRAETNIIRYNWIEGGKNSQLDLVDSDYGDGVRANAYVYGNVIVKPAVTNNSRMINFGGESQERPRKGTLHFFNNTCIVNSERDWGTRRLFDISSDSANVIADNNIFYMNDNSYELWAGRPNITGSNNWFSDIARGDSLLENGLRGEDPGFMDFDNKDFHIVEGSPGIDFIRGYEFPEGHELLFQYLHPTSFEERPITNEALDIGAFYFPNQVEDIVSPNFPETPVQFKMYPAYPNPFNSTTTITFQLPFQSNVRLSVHDLVGREVAVLVNQNLTPGTHEVRWEADDQPSGMYFCMMEASGFRISKGVAFVR